MIGTALWRSCLSYRSRAHTVASWFTRLATCVAVLASASHAAAQVTYEVVADLSSIGAALPLGGLIVGPDGALYGTASAGGHGDGCGVVYRLDASGAVTAASRLRLAGRLRTGGRARRGTGSRFVRRHPQRW